MTVKVKSPVREALAGCSSRNDYYDSKDAAVCAVCSVLNHYGYILDSAEFDGNEGSVNVGFWEGYSGSLLVGGIGDYAGYVHFSWYRMPSGRWEFTVYIT